MPENNLGQQLNCLFGHCKREIKIMTAMTIKQIPQKAKIMKEFKEGKIKKDEYIKQMIDLEEKLYVCKDFKKMGECALKNCGDLMKIKLDNILKKLKKSKMIKPVYSVDDYTKIHWMERKNMLETEFKEKLK
jgi:hypothetical protein